jgi:hypothetical protein
MIHNKYLLRSLKSLFALIFAAFIQKIRRKCSTDFKDFYADIQLKPPGKYKISGNLSPARSTK